MKCLIRPVDDGDVGQERFTGALPIVSTESAPRTHTELYYSKTFTLCADI